MRDSRQKWRNKRFMNTQLFLSVPLIEIYLLRIRDAIIPELGKHLDALLYGHVIALTAGQEVQIFVLEVRVVNDQSFCGAQKTRAIESDRLCQIFFSVCIKDMERNLKIACLRPKQLNRLYHGCPIGFMQHGFRSPKLNNCKEGWTSLIYKTAYMSSSTLQSARGQELTSPQFTSVHLSPCVHVGRNKKVLCERMGFTFPRPQARGQI